MALDAARVLGPVFPLSPGTKQPSVADGFYAARDGKGDILEMARTRPGHLWALRTGKASGVVAIDADSDEAYAWMSDRFGPPHVRTRRGGHWYFKHPGGKGTSTTEIGLGSDALPDALDRKTDGGYVEIPSEHGTKTWTNGLPNPDDLPDLPDDLNQKRAKAPALIGSAPGLAGVVGELIAENGEGGRHELSLALAGALIRHFGDEGGAALEAGWQSAMPGDRHDEIRRTITDTAAKITEDAAVCGIPALEERAPGAWKRITEAAGHDPAAPKTLTVGGTVARLNADPRQGDHAAPDPFAFYDLTTAPTEPPETLVPGLILRGLVHSIYAAAGMGKTWTALYAVAQTVARGEKVVYVDKENGPRIMRERLSLMGVDLKARGHLIRYAPFPNAGMDAPTVEAWAAMLEREEPALVVFDSWVGFLASCGLDENLSVDIAKWSEAYAAPARSRGVAVLILDHVPKADSKSARGSGRKLDYVDVQFEQSSNTFDRERMGQIKLSKRKDREAWLPNTLVFEVGGTPGGVDGSRLIQPGFVFRPIDEPHKGDDPGLTNGERATLAALVDGMTYAEWFDAADKSNSTFNRHRVALTDGGHVIHDEATGTYSHYSHGTPTGVNGSKSLNPTYNSHYSHHPKGGSSGSTGGGAVVDDSKPAPEPNANGPDASVKGRVAEYLTTHGHATIAAHSELGMRPLAFKDALEALVDDGRASKDGHVYQWAGG
jgi:hypothetical protein